MKRLSTISSLVLMIVFLMTQNVCAQENTFENISFNTEDGATIEASYFKAGKNSIVIFAHGAIFNKESWYFLAKEFQKKNTAVLSIDFRGYGNSKAVSKKNKFQDILGAIDYAKSQGFKEVNLIGASMGGRALLTALSYKDVPVHKVVLLSPAGGAAIKSNKIEKLFIVSKEEGLYQRVQQIYTKSSEIKKIKEYSGSAHAQHLFKTTHAEELKQLILDFIIL